MEDRKFTYAELETRLTNAEAIIKALQEGEIDATILGNKQVVLIRPEETVRQTEADLRASERRYRSLVMATTQMVWRTDPTGHFVDELSTWQTYTGCCRRDLLETGWLKTIHPDDRPGFQAAWQQSISSQSKFDFEARIRRYDGHYRVFRIRGVPILDNDNAVEEWIGTCTDITERQQAEREKDRLLAAVSRQREQLRALTRQLAEAQEAERKALARELHDQIGQSLTALDLNLNLISNQISKPTTNVPDIVHSRLVDSLALVGQTAERIRDVMATLRPSVLDDYGLVAALRWYGNKFTSRTGAHVKVDGEEVMPRLATPVEDTLFRIAQEALTNVAKHAQAERVWINIGSQNGRIRMIIRDDGRGFDYARQYESDDRKHWGLLTIIEQTEAMGGHCEINSQRGQGTRLVIDIPR